MAALKVKKLHEDAILPTKARRTDAGWDLYSLEDVMLYPLHPTKIRTGIALALPELTYGLICDRSSMGIKGIKVMGGVIDQEYRGEIIVCLNNCGSGLSISEHKLYKIKKGDKIAQLVIHDIPVLRIDLEEVTELDETSRGDKGFGSSGR